MDSGIILCLYILDESGKEAAFMLSKYEPNFFIFLNSVLHKFVFF